MSGAEWVGIITATGAILTLMGKAVAWAVGLLMEQFRATIAELKEANQELEDDRDYWRNRALGTSPEKDGAP